MTQKNFKSNSAMNNVIIAGQVSKVVNENGGIDFYLRRYLNKQGDKINYVDLACTYLFFSDSKGENKSDKIVKGSEILVSGHFESKNFFDKSEDVRSRENCIVVDDFECFTSDEDLKKLREENKREKSENNADDSIISGSVIYILNSDGSYEKFNRVTGVTLDLFFDTKEEVLKDIEKEETERLKRKSKSNKG